MTRTLRIKRKENRASATVGGGIKSADDIPVSFRYERLIIVGLCLAAAIRVFVFSAAFPFFNNVDEHSHFDVVFKYSHGHLPAALLEKYDPEAAGVIARCATGEYLGVEIDHSPESVARITAHIANEDNPETCAWPAYYFLAGLWCRLGESLAMTDFKLLYWIRFLNVPLAAVFVWLSWVFSRRFFGDNFQERIAIPLIAAFFPQDIFFAITGDVLSPIVFAAAFFMLLEIYLSQKSWQYHLFAGLLVAATFLTKASNVAIIPIAAFVVFVKVIQFARRKNLRQHLFPLAALVIAALLPVALWLGRNYILFGDLTGAAGSISHFSWTIKPFSAMFDHPIFTPSGLFYFLTELAKNFWRGEFVWQFKPIASAVMDWFYIISSAVFVSASILGLIMSRTQTDKSNRFAITAGLFAVIFSIMFLAVMSMRFDFRACFYPSRDKPYFVAGRLIAGAILPFIILYIDGLRRILSKLRCASALLFAVGIIVAVITVSEVSLSWSVFTSPNNWFHLMK